MINYSFSIYDLEYFLLILTRISCFVFIAPFFSMNKTPRTLRVGLSFFTSLLLYQALTPAEGVAYSTLLEYALMVIKEALTGLLIGFSATICTSIVNFAGSIADMEIGLSMVTLMDPTSREATSITGVLYQYVLTLMMVASGMYRYLFGALADSFVLIPVSGAVFRGDSLLSIMVEFLGDYVMIGFRIVLPVFCDSAAERCAGCPGQGVAPAEHVCSGYSAESAGGSFHLYPDGQHASGGGGFYL